ncbi:uncharacterized protein LOC116211949 isoform X1 [Punica granatum]|nr:uncharacterized protein LOC116211949 isoform X1 [Punica granatum]OWM68341.1 hypothetical protein CDL15_Pgr004823 [Punica granatum]
MKEEEDRQVTEMQRDEKADDSLSRPGIFVIGSSNVGKRTLLSRLLSADFEDRPDSTPDVSVHGWNINTKYYNADVSVWMAHLHEGFDIGSLPIFDRLEALVMVFDISNISSLTALQDWVSKNDIKNFEILLCIGNKVDRLPGHPVHAEYRRRLLKLEDESSDYYGELTEGGISEAEGTSLLGEEEPSSEIKRSCLEWCSTHNIEYIEACASNADFDKCLSVDGDQQGVERLFGALSAHMWPGMSLKSGDKITEPSLPEKQDSSEDERESEYEFDYEILSAGSAEPWDDTEWVSASDPGTSSQVAGSVAENVSSTECNGENGTIHDEKDHQALKLDASSSEKTDDINQASAQDPDEDSELEQGGASFDFKDLEQLMSEIGNTRDNLRFMPDFQRREMAAQLALKMASMFGGSSDEEE